MKEDKRAILPQHYTHRKPQTFYTVTSWHRCKKALLGDNYILSKYIPDGHVLHLLWRYLKRTVCYGGNYRDVIRGISLGCPLSPLIAALFMKPLDDAMQKTGLFYVR